MFKQVCSFAAGAVLAMSGYAADAATVTKTIIFEAKNFQVDYGAPAPAPVDPVVGSITLTFDDAVYVEDQTAGVTVNHFSLPVSGPIAFSYNPGPFGGYFLLIGAVLGGFDTANGYSIGSSDFVMSTYYPFTDAPALPSLSYSRAGQLNSWYTGQVAITSFDGPAVPEPAIWALMFIGFAAAGANLRARRRGLA